MTQRARTTGTFLRDEIPKGGNVVRAKRVVGRKTDGNDLITKARARLVAGGFGQGSALDYFETFPSASIMASAEVDMVVAVQEGWPRSHFDVTQAFVRARMDSEMFEKHPDGCGPLDGHYR